MAGILGRITRVFGSSDDPQPTDPLQNSYGQQTQLLQEVRRGAAEVATSRKRLAQQMAQLASEIDSLTMTARRALEQGRDDLAREALLRKQSLTDELATLDDEHDRLQLTEEQLVLTSTRLQAKLDAIRTKQKTIWATFSATEAQTRVDQALAGLDPDLGHAEDVVREAARHGGAPIHAQQTADADDLSERAERAAEELVAMKSELAGREPVDATHGSYRQPAPSQDAGEIRDEWHAEGGTSR